MQRFQGKFEDSYVYWYNGFTYYLDNRNERYPILRCTFKKDCCKAVIYLESSIEIMEQNITVTGHHLDMPDHLYPLRREFKEELQLLSRATFDDLKQIYDVVKAKEKYEPLRLEINYNLRYKQIMQAARKQNVPPIPSDLTELHEILDEYEPMQNIYRGCAYGLDGSKSLIFIHDSMLEPLRRCSQLFCDGTFKIRPRQPTCAQIFMAHFRKLDSGFPAIYAIMSNKTTESYEALWQHVLNIIPSMKENIKLYTSDFEKAQIQAAKIIFTDARIVGCLFHSKQAMTKRWAKLRIPFRFNDILEKCYAIPHLPSDKITEGVNIIQQTVDSIPRQNRGKLQEFVNYLRRVWVPLADVLSVFNNPIRTNNGCENFHFLAAKKIGARPIIWKFLDELKKIMINVADRYKNVEAGRVDRPHRPFHLQQADLSVIYAETELLARRYSVEDFMIRIASLRRIDLARVYLRNSASRTVNADLNNSSNDSETNDSDDDEIDVNFFRENFNRDAGAGGEFENVRVVRRRRRNQALRDELMIGENEAGDRIRRVRLPHAVERNQLPIQGRGRARGVSNRGRGRRGSNVGRGRGRRVINGGLGRGRWFNDVEEEVEDRSNESAINSEEDDPGMRERRLRLSRAGEQNLRVARGQSRGGNVGLARGRSIEARMDDSEEEVEDRSNESAINSEEDDPGMRERRLRLSRAGGQNLRVARGLSRGGNGGLARGRGFRACMDDSEEEVQYRLDESAINSEEDDSAIRERHLRLPRARGRNLPVARGENRGGNSCSGIGVGFETPVQRPSHNEENQNVASSSVEEMQNGPVQTDEPDRISVEDELGISLPSTVLIEETDLEDEEEERSFHRSSPLHRSTLFSPFEIINETLHSDSPVNHSTPSSPIVISDGSEERSFYRDLPIHRSTPSPQIEISNEPEAIPVFLDVQVPEDHQNELQILRNRHALAAEARIQMDLRQSPETASISGQPSVNENIQNENLNAEQINNLTEKTGKNKKRKRRGSGQRSRCCVCYTKNSQIMRPCKHKICKKCALGWFKKNRKSCPLCRAVVESWLPQCLMPRWSDMESLSESDPEIIFIDDEVIEID